MKIVTAEDHLVLRDLLRKMCSGELGHTVLAEAVSGPDAIAAVYRFQPDILILDIELSGCDGYDVIDRVRDLAAPPRIIVLSGTCDEYTLVRSQCPAVRGYLDKGSTGISTIKDCLTAVADGRVYFSEAFQALRRRRSQSNSPWVSDVLTNREQQVLALIGGLLEDHEIATRLRISADTAEKHRFNIQKKLHQTSRLELIRHARKLGFMPRTS